MIFSLNENSKYRLTNPERIKLLVQFKITSPSNFLTLNKKKLSKNIILPKNCSTTVVVFTCSPIMVSNETSLVKNNKRKPNIKKIKE
tara:strand:- start:228 stop:488 length:261 start_codon:yes stop_codon:yes gene_type:complete